MSHPIRNRLKGLSQHGRRIVSSAADVPALMRTAGRCLRGLVGGFVAICGAIVLGMLGVVGLLGAVLVAAAVVSGLLAIGTVVWAGAFGRESRHVAARAGVRFVAVGSGLGESLWQVGERFRSPREILWAFATATGTVGLILLMVLQASGLPAAAKQARPGTWHVVRRPPVMALAQAEPADDDLFGGLPDPFFEAPVFDEPDAAPPQSEPPVDAAFDDPFEPIPAEAAEPQLPAEAELVLDVERADLPADIARFDVRDDDERFVVAAGATVADVDSFPADDWLLAMPREREDRRPVVPAAYRESREIDSEEVAWPEPAETADRFVPASRSVGVTVRKTQPAEAAKSELLWYDLIVTNTGEEAITRVLVEEQVAEPHRVADAWPAAAFRDGLLTWRLDALAAGEEKRLSVAIYPMSETPIATTAAVRPVAEFSAVTLVQAEEPRIEEPPVEELLVEEPPVEEPSLARPDPLIEPVPDELPLRRIRIAMTTPERVANGSGCVVRFAVTNTGTVALSGVAVRGILPEGLSHPHGPAVESDLGALAPGETRTTELHLTAASMGEAELIAEVNAREGVSTTVRGTLDIVEALPAVDARNPCCCEIGALGVPAN